MCIIGGTHFGLFTSASLLLTCMPLPIYMRVARMRRKKWVAARPANAVTSCPDGHKENLRVRAFWVGNCCMNLSISTEV